MANGVSFSLTCSVAMSAKAGCIAVWSQFAPPLPHEKNAQNGTDYRTIAGLAGLQTLWRENRLDFLALSHDEVDSAVRYALNELNGLPEWFPSLLELRPEDALRTLDQAVSGEWELPEELEHVYDVIAKFAWMPNPPELIMRSILKRLQHNDPLHPNILKYSLAILLRNNDLDIQRLASIAHERVTLYAPEQPQWHSWMSAWLHLDALPALDHLEQSLSRMESDDQADALVIRLCAATYGRREGMGKSSHLSYLEAAPLGRLIPLVYKHVRPGDDIDRIGESYSPGARDFAQEFRSFLWEGLEKNPDPVADNVLHDFMSMPIMDSRRDWILHLIDVRRGLRAERTIWEPRDVRTFTIDYCSEPRSDYSLFQLVRCAVAIEI